ncbi:putative actin-binding protein ABP140 [Saccharata proteae CBS 121410]|uniref:tRNA N(3)-methylcytidine methyltransferase n=1 Tax=Saccharata proteae CBS 121410 TaxID=1314787 RepID=A0A9P4LZ34_9PEZI|nr:putative actin-binding protein ABP140 [Saccharata proteae CBS 121410]
MEHIRYAVTVDPVPAQSSTYGVPSSVSDPVRKPASRSHDASNNQKRTDPFQFGSRYLEEGDDVFEFNAWDHVETDDTYKEFAELQYARQRESPVSDFDKTRFNNDPAKWWNLFYKNNTNNFFKNRKWLFQEFPILAEFTKKEAGPAVLLEVGAGAGNTAFPVLALNENPSLKIHACDFSKTAVQVIRENESYDNGKMIQADVWDVAGTGEQSLPPGIEPGSVDVVLMIFIFSALAPAQWDQAVRNIWRALKPGGHVLFRDYGRGDLAQVRFKKGRYLDENFYVRGDGTRVYFFEKEELEKIWGGMHGEKTTDAEDASSGNATENDQENLEAKHIGVDRRMLVNRQRKLKMYRCWMQAVFQKPAADAQTAEPEAATTELSES